jgi:hypothetical protein
MSEPLSDGRSAHAELEDRVAHALCPEERTELRRQLNALVASQQDRWLSGWARPPHTALSWSRGFVHELHFLQLGSLAEALAAVQSLVEHPAGQRLEGLGFAGLPLGDEGAAQLASCSALRQLRRLFLSHTAIRDAGARALARSPYLQQLELLEMGHTG